MSFDPTVVGRDLARRSRKAQGLPEHVEDEAVVAKVAGVLRHAPVESRREVEVESGAAS